MIITLTTDFGLSSPYVGAMKGVILGINPEVRVVDITHSITPQNVDEAAFVLKSAYPYFPKGTIHAVVVDPGVGSGRSILAVRVGDYIFLAPDNGVLKTVFDAYPEAEVYQVTNREYFIEPVSRTFHGRDIIAPVAAHLSKKIELESVGQLFPGYLRGDVRKPLIDSDVVRGEIIYIDGFGNGITNIEETTLIDKKPVLVRVRDCELKGIARVYAEAEVDKPLAVFNSMGSLEISINRGNAEKVLGLRVGDSVSVEFRR